jgi:type I restriction-modification system DNA methylase subunit
MILVIQAWSKAVKESLPMPTLSEPDLMETYKNKKQADINNKIREITEAKGTDRSAYSSNELQFITLYEGAGGLAKQGEEGVRLLDQFFTPDKIIKIMWELALRHGFNFNNSLILEPSFGSGRFLKYIPEGTNARVMGFEIDKTSYIIGKVLYPDYDLRLASFETLFFQGKRNIGLVGVTEQFDLVIGNPPYRNYASSYSVLGEKEATGADLFEHYFIMRGVDVLKQNGLLVFIIPNTFLSNDNKYNDFKEKLYRKADLIDAYRLPNHVFENTAVGTDLVVLRKR